MHRTRFERKWIPSLFCDRAGMRLAQCRGTFGIPETALSILCYRGHRHAGGILSGIKADCEFWEIQEEEKKLLCQMMELDECLVRRSFVTLDEDGNILTAQGPLSFFQDKIVRKRIRKRIVTVEVELLGEKRRIELGIRLPEDK